MTQNERSEFTIAQRLYPKITESTKRNWDKSIAPIAHMKVVEIDDDQALDYLENAMGKWAEGTVKRIDDSQRDLD